MQATQIWGYCRQVKGILQNPLGSCVYPPKQQDEEAFIRTRVSVLTGPPRCLTALLIHITHVYFPGLECFNKAKMCP